jgi:hypothetical protein
VLPKQRGVPFLDQPPFVLQRRRAVRPYPAQAAVARPAAGPPEASPLAADRNSCILPFLKDPYVVMHYKEKGDMSRWILVHGHRGGRQTGTQEARRKVRTGFGNQGRFCTILLMNFVLIFKKTIANITNHSKYEDFVVDRFRNSSGYFRNKNLLSALLGSVFVPAIVSGFSYLIINTYVS